MNIAIIPARGGSRRIPRKNIKMFCGKPMIAWSIEAAHESGIFDCIIVSTDDEDIGRIAESYGAEVPFRRPAELADDYTGTTAVIAHAVGWAQQQEWPLVAVCCLHATAPFVRPVDLKVGFEMLMEGDWDFCFTVTEFPAPIFRSFKIAPNGGVEMFFPECFAKRSQDLPEALHDAGQFYWGRPQAWLNQTRLFGPRSRPLILPQWRVQDIDTEEDWMRAELIWQAVQVQDDV